MTTQTVQKVENNSYSAPAPTVEVVPTAKTVRGSKGSTKGVSPSRFVQEIREITIRLLFDAPFFILGGLWLIKTQIPWVKEYGILVAFVLGQLALASGATLAKGVRGLVKHWRDKSLR